ncbi:TIGR04282 family arsenosugar biosynthesis glycosyltransferase [Tenacibaculum maritimum]|uniref:TIGR04282 family arsenosugar biosynthesis glycosyltransferase n=1 Tax=Tenacibaculum maritimum TaxID=107401 RepID=UPI001E29E8AF|nr:TIGR04282 family arsenosugar biosynthesis glycosyltransferase [Tenacibaculum maritimum]MCD9585056.1 TIGR04282 family arsenosugar biosynthesis glycosyltransferase [Tenacibaculum maritimum]MCD9620838.1 TIGR04282 family arsenosugar biosynthesis glycosyltransferase [Tenacibaculum maritimum]MCD9626877.1 TIGR04282 family arsenosugar biosynthesis glycosyltransferase [Tenacibaculum maritimum]MCD9629540.1 TIGR04282 family arsenosugar biosynthesis glycosyltransferase [Tenacibaculum maritimum]MCD96326
MNKNLLLIFTRNPELGKVKTRLAKAVGNETALTIYKFLLDKTKKVTQNLNCDKAVYYSVQVRNHDIWEEKNYQKKLQKGEDLGIRMHNAFQEAFENNYEKVLIIGSDLYDLTPNHIHEAFDKLNSNEVVIGPAKDGGYYLLGMKKLIPSIFKNKNWGTSSVRKDTLKDLEKVNVHLLEPLNDVDLIEDIEDHPAFYKFLK